jgi:hypothetical protein
MWNDTTRRDRTRGEKGTTLSTFDQVMYSECFSFRRFAANDDWYNMLVHLYGQTWHIFKPCFEYHVLCQECISFNKNFKLSQAGQILSQAFTSGTFLSQPWLKFGWLAGSHAFLRASQSYRRYNRKRSGTEDFIPWIAKKVITHRFKTKFLVSLVLVPA